MRTHQFTATRCPNCHQDFTPRHRDQRYCCKPCRYAHRHPNDTNAPAHQSPQEREHTMAPIDEFQPGALVRAHRHEYVGRITQRVDEDLVKVEWLKAKDHPALQKPTLEQVATLWIDTPTDQPAPDPQPVRVPNTYDPSSPVLGHLMVMRFTYRVGTGPDDRPADRLIVNSYRRPLPETAPTVSVLADNRDVAAAKAEQVLGTPPPGQAFQLDLVSIEELGGGI